MTFFIGRFQIVFTCAPSLCVLTRQVIPLYLMLQRCVTFRHLYNQCDMAIYVIYLRRICCESLELPADKKATFHSQGALFTDAFINHINPVS